MKLKASFSPRLPVLGPALTLSLLAIAVGMVVLTLVMIVNAAHQKTERSRLQQQLAALAQRQPATEPRQPPHAQILELQRRVAALNRLSSYHGSPLPTLLARLEPLLPDRAYLVSLHQRPQTGEVDMTVEAATSEPLTLFLARLQRDSHFADVLLTKQARPGGNGPQRVQFQLRLRERDT